MKFRIIACALALSSCTTLPTPVTVIANGETAAPTSSAGTAGDPTLWTGGRGSASGLAQTGFLASTSRREAIVIHDLEGVVAQRVPGAPLSSIDIAALPLTDNYTILIGGTERSGGRTRIALYRMEPHGDQPARRWGEIPTDLSAPRGFCMRQVSGVLRVVVIDRRGEARQMELEEGPDGQAVSRETRRYRVSDAAEGCAIDPNNAQVYFGHARQGFWRYSLAPSGDAVPTRLVATANERLPRSRGFAFLTRLRNRFLVSLDEDSAAFSVWRLQGAELTWLGRVEVREQVGGRAVRNVAGLDAYGGSFGSYEDGVVVVQDQTNDGAPNLKLIRWSDVEAALGL